MKMAVKKKRARAVINHFFDGHVCSLFDYLLELREFACPQPIVIEPSRLRS